MLIYEYHVLCINELRDNHEEYAVRLRMSHDDRAMLDYDSILDNVRVSCFSQSPIINLMWSHYAESHAGICYAMRFNPSSSIPFDFQEEGLGWGHVQYSSLLPEVTAFESPRNMRSEMLTCDL